MDQMARREWVGMDALACRPPSPMPVPVPLPPSLSPCPFLSSSSLSSLPPGAQAFPVGVCGRPKSKPSQVPATVAAAGCCPCCPCRCFVLWHLSRLYPPLQPVHPSVPFARRLSPVTRQAVTRQLRCRTEYSSVVYHSVARCGAMRGNAVRCHAA